MTTERPSTPPDSLAEMRESVVMNPSAIGNPDEEPVVFVGADLRRWLNPCEADAPSRGGYCGGVNGYHAEDCPTQNGPERTTP